MGCRGGLSLSLLSSQPSMRSGDLLAWQVADVHIRVTSNGSTNSSSSPMRARLAGTTMTFNGPLRSMVFPRARPITWRKSIGMDVARFTFEITLGTCLHTSIGLGVAALA